ncbi:hypothetical protein FRC04_011321 [Tulasnella sp. 424]|nr:hypothetical protein FRC04_011321 [Tulasnella sp. 424]KAG8975509.1 hypothetical protein FRC05_005578 [Tulasnella sp. 425]
MASAVFREDQIIPPISAFERIKGTEALTVPEILRAILDHVTPPTLASAAQVSKAWSAVALDKLWSDFDIEVLDLLRDLPLQSKPFIPQCSSYTYWELRRDPTDEEWTRFHFYASRVRSLSVPRHAYGFHPSITKWKAENDVVFPRLRRVEWPLSIEFSIPTSQLSSFATRGLKELSLTIPRRRRGSRIWDVAMSTFHDLAAVKGLQLKKFKLSSHMTRKFGDTISHFVTAQGDSLQALELLAPCARVSPLPSHSLRNLRALSIHISHVTGAKGANTMQPLVEACPRVSHLRMEITEGGFDLDLPGLHATLGWQLLSFDVRSSRGFRIIKAHLATMANAWPKLKKLGFDVADDPRGRLFDHFNPRARRIPFSCLADIVAAFPEVEQLGVVVFCDLDEANPLSVSRSSSPLRCPSKLRKLRFNRFSLPKSKEQQETMARFMAAVCPAGLRVERMPNLVQAPVLLPVDPAVQAVVVEGRDSDPEWDALFQRVEELHGGVKVWVGSIPEEDNDVWF